MRKPTVLVSGLLLVAAVFVAAAAEINMVKLHVDSFWVIGLQTRTSNQENQIGQLWKRLYEEGILDRIPNRIDSHVVAVYSDYESDKDGAYTFTLGAKVSSTAKIPDGLFAKKVVSGDYGMFTAAGGPIQDLVVSLWKQIWSLESRSLHRAYQTDFEVYEEHLDPQNGRVDIYIGTKKQ